MSVGRVNKRAIQSLNAYNFVALNFSGPDMIGHTGDLNASIKAVEFVDLCIGKLEKEVLKRNGILIITADHGNAEVMIHPKTQEICTMHTSNLVPFILVSRKLFKLKKKPGLLSDICPTILELFNIQRPNMITGKSLII